MNPFLNEFDALVAFLNIGEDEFNNVGVWSDGSFTYEGIEYEVKSYLTDDWECIGMAYTFYIYKTDNPV